MIDIFASEAEFRAIVPVNAGFNFDELKPDIDTAFRKYVQPYLTREQYDASVAYVAGADLAKHTELLALIKKACGYLGEWLFFPMAKVELTGTSVKYTEDKATQASAEDKKDVADSLLSKGLMAIEDMLEFLEANKNIFTVWRDGTGYAKYTAFFIRTADEFRLIEGSRLVFNKLLPFLEDAQWAMSSILPADAYAKLKSREYGTVEAGEIALWDELLRRYVQPIAAAEALGSAITAMIIHITPEGKYAAFDNTQANAQKGYMQLAFNIAEKRKDELKATAARLITQMQGFIQANATLFGWEAPEAPQIEVFTNTEEHATKFFGSFR